MSTFRFTLLLLSLVFGGFFVGFQFGQIAHVVGGWVREVLALLAVACLCGAMMGSVIMGVFAFAHEIEKCEVVRHEDGRPFQVTLIIGPWRWTREVPTETIEAQR